MKKLSKGMKTMSLQEVHEHWQETIASLVSEGEILITSDNQEVARLVAMGGENQARAASSEEITPLLDTFTVFTAASLAKWRDEVFGEETIDTLSDLMADRDDRFVR